MTDTLERFLDDLRFDVPAGLVDRAKAAAVVIDPETVVNSRVLPSRSRDLVENHHLAWNGPADRRRTMGRRTELAAGIAAVVIAAIVIGSFAYIRAVSRPHTVSPPTHSVPRPSPALTRPLNVDPATPVLLFNDAGDNYQVDGMTWDGRSGALTEVPTGGQNLVPAESSNPAGTLFVAFPNILDRSGRVVAKLSGPYSDPRMNDFLGAWADDEQHYCQVAPALAAGANPLPGTLQLTTPRGTPRNVVKVGNQGPDGSTLTVTVCSVLADRAVVVQREQSFIQYWVVQLSNGRVIWTHNLNSTCPPPIPTVSGCGLANVVASRDGRYVAEVQPTNTSFIYRPDGSKAEVLPTGPSTIYGPNGSPVRNIDGAVSAFSWDGSLALVTVSSAGRARMSLIRWMDGTVIWTAPDGKKIWGVQPEPGGTSLAILTGDPAGYGRPSTPIVLQVVSSDGRVIGQQEVGWSLLACLPIACGGAAW